MSRTARRILAETAHRPWSLPKRPWVMAQSWQHLLFAHWRVDADALRQVIPAGLEIDIYGGEAWVGVVPFTMIDVHARGLPNIPGTSTFPELNVRTYVTRDGKAGVWFFSLDATNALAVWGARRFFHLPYFKAEMQSAKEPAGRNFEPPSRQDRQESDGEGGSQKVLKNSPDLTPSPFPLRREGRKAMDLNLLKESEWVRYASRRVDTRARGADFEARFRPIAPVYRAEAGSLDAWLTERYCLYAADGRGRIVRCEVQHAPWALQRAEAEISVNTMIPAGLGANLNEAPLLHYSERIDVLAWYLERLA